MKSTQSEEMRTWVGELSGTAVVEQLDAAWAEFAGCEQPVATLFGAFDTGKSSTLRRLLVDSEQPVPDWLSISARHETFSVEVVDVAGCAIRDTPGLSPQGQDARSLRNSQVARSTLGLTDVLLVTLNPQLATGERDELLKILAHGWPESCVWFLISRADEGGVDPALDEAGFEEWAERKRDELRASLGLNEASPIHVIVPDYGQLGAFETHPEPSLWDISRPWDGMDHLRASLLQLSSWDLAESRTAAAHRYWRNAVSERLEDLRGQLEDLTTSLRTASASLQRKNLFIKQLDGLIDAARISLEGTTEDAIRRVLLSPRVDAGSLQSAVDPVLQEWWQEQQAGLARIRQDALRAFDQQRAGRAWATFESLYSPLAQSDSEEPPGERHFTPQFAKLGRKAVEGLKSVDDVRQAHRAVKHPGQATKAPQSGSGLGQAAGISAAVLPFLVELAGIIEDEVQKANDKARERARRQQVAAEVTHIVKDAADLAMSNLTPDVDALRQEISDQTIGQDEVHDLEVAVKEATNLLAQGEALLSS